MDDRQRLAEASTLLDPALQDWARSYLSSHWKRYTWTIDQVEARAAAGARVLEVGSLPGHMTYLLHARGFDVTGIDLAPERAGTFFDDIGVTVHRCDVETEPLPSDDGTFDVVVFTELLEHCRINPIATLRELGRVLAPAGFMLVTTPNLYTTGTVLRYLRGHGFDDPVTEWGKLEKLGHMGHVRLYSAKQLRWMLAAAGLRTDELEHFAPRAAKGRARLLLDASWRLAPKSRPYLMAIARPS